MADHFQPRQGQQDFRTWFMVRRHQEVVSCPDYLLATDRQTLSNVVVRDPCHKSDQYMVLG